MNKATKWLLLAIFLGQSLVFADPLFEAAGRGKLEEVKRLLDSGADIESGGREPPLVVAATRGHLPVVQELLKRGANINAKSAECGSALTGAIAAHNLPMVQELLEHGANVNAELEGSSAIIWAVMLGDLPIMQELLKYGANVHAKSSKGLTTLMAAILVNSPVVVQELLMAKADINAKSLVNDTDLRTALMLAAAKKHAHLIKIIREWSIVKQIPITDSGDIKILDEDSPGSYKKAYDYYAERTAIITEKTGIPTPHPASIINEYLGNN